jgi:uncharacterized membrane protein
MDLYTTLKILHVFGVVLFLGNIIVTGVWKAYADRTGHAPTIAFAQRLVTITDWIFTFGGSSLVVAAGYGMATHAGYDLMGERWLFWGQVMIYLSGLIWVVILIPIQIFMARMARTFADGGEIPAKYWRLNRHWYIWGIISILLPLVNLYWMIAKP